MDETRPNDPEVRYYNASDSTDARALAEYIESWVGGSGVAAREYQDPSARPGYIEIWLGR